MLALLLALALQDACDVKFARLAKYCNECDKLHPTTARKCPDCDAKNISVKVCEKVGYCCPDCGDWAAEPGDCTAGHAAAARTKILDESRLIYVCADESCAIVEREPGNCVNGTCPQNGKPLVRACMKSGTPPHTSAFPAPGSNTERKTAAPVDPLKEAGGDPAGYLRRRFDEAIAAYLERDDWEVAGVLREVGEAAGLGLTAAAVEPRDAVERANLPTMEECVDACATVHASMGARDETPGRLIRAVPEMIDALRMINDLRVGLGLRPVSMDAAASLECMKHALNTSRTGELGAKRCLVSGGSLRAGVRGWIGGFYGRVPLMNPGLRRVGFGVWTVESGPGSNCLVDVETHAKRERAELIYPFNGQTDVPPAFTGEEPSPVPAGGAGTPVVVTLPAGAKIKDVSVEFVAAGGKAIEFYLSTPDAPANRAVPDNLGSIGVIPKAMLEPLTTYRVTIKAAVDGTAKTWTTEFTTR